MTAAPELVVVESPDALEIESPMPVGKRILFFLLALFPLIAPWELLLEPRWTGYANVFFLFAAAVSLGALCLTALLFWAAVAGIRSRMRFDPSQGLFSNTAWAPAMGTRSSEVSLDAVASVEIRRHEWSDGAPSYSLEVGAADGRTFKTGSSWSRAEVAALRQRVEAFRGRTGTVLASPRGAKGDTP